MFRALPTKLRPNQLDHLFFPVSVVIQKREMHTRNKKAMEFIAKGWSALKGVDRVINSRELNDRRLIPLLSTAKENFELALEADNSNTRARYWLAKLHFKYHVPGKCPAVGAALLVEAANMRDPDAQYDLSCHLRVESFGPVIMMYFDHFTSDQPSFYYLEKDVDQLHPGALYLHGAVYLAGDCVKQDLGSAMWCFHRPSEKGDMAVQALRVDLPFSEVAPSVLTNPLLPMLKWKRRFGLSYRGIQVCEVLLKFSVRRGAAARKSRTGDDGSRKDPVEMARKQFEIAAKAGCDLGFRWLTRLEEGEKSALATWYLIQDAAKKVYNYLL